VPRVRGFTPRVARSGARRKTQWSQLADQGFVSLAAAGSTLVSSIAFTQPGTIVRARGRLGIRANVFTADANPVGAFGVGVVSEEAAAIGITAIPLPFSDADWGGWMVWQSWCEAFQTEGASPATQFLASWSFDIDSKAMRKVEPNTRLVFVAESQSEAVLVCETVRVLQMLH